MPDFPRLLWKNLPASSLEIDTMMQRAWDALNATRGDLPFLAAAAMNTSLTTLGDGSERLLVANDGSATRAMFLLTRQGRLRWRTFQPSQLPVGAWVAEAQLPLVEVARSLMRGPLGLCLGLSITQVDPNVAERSQDAADSLSINYIETGWINIEGNFDIYWAARGKNLRQNMRKQRAKLAADGVTLTMQVLRDHTYMAAAVARYGHLEGAGWKAQAGTAIQPDNAQGRYYRELLESASLRAEAVVYQYLFDEQVVAMNLCLLRKGTLVVLKTTYDESIRSFSPAFLLRESELHEIYREGKIKRVEYFGRLMEWHTKLTDLKRTMYHLTLYRFPLLKRLAVARQRNAEGTVAHSQYRQTGVPAANHT